MPLVIVKWNKGRTKAQKAELAKVITDALVNIGKATQEHAWIVFEDVDKENWSIGGKLLE